MKKTWQRGFSALLTLAMLLSLLVVPAAAANDLTITEAKGWMESAYVKFTGTAERYNVYVAPQGGSYDKLDNELVRTYEGYFRADALGLAAGKYTMKVVPVVDGAEVEQDAVESQPLTVENYVREGFAFSENSPNGGSGVGAYNDDGTLKDGARVIYVTDGNKDTVTVPGLNYNNQPAVGLAKILHAMEKDQSTPIAIRIIGRVTDPDGILQGGSANEFGADAHTAQIVKTKNFTLEGVGDDAVIHGWVITFKRSNNIEVRNLATMWGGEGGEGSSFVLEDQNYNSWFHNIDFFYNAPGKDADQVKGDGTIDLKKKSSYCTISYNHMWDIGKTCVSGGPDEVKNFDKPEWRELYATYHHNWFDHTDSRHPRCVVGSNHVYNNYYDGCGDYGIGAAMRTSVFSECNYFRNVPRPMLIGTQGSECWDGTQYTNKGSLSGQGGGIIKSYGDVMITPRRFYAYGDPFLAEGTIHEGQFDAVVVENRNDTIPNTIQAKTSSKIGSTYEEYGVYNNFDTDSSIMYSYTPHTADQVVEVVTANAGRMNGGDFKWTFNNAVDDSLKALNTEMQAAIRNYESPLKAVAFGDVAVVPPEKPPVVEPSADPSASADPSSSTAPATPPGTMKKIPAGVTTLAKDWNGGQTMNQDAISADGYVTCYKGNNSYKTNNFSADGVTATRGYATKGVAARSFYIIPEGECNVTVYFYTGNAAADDRALSLYTTSLTTPAATYKPEANGDQAYTYHFTEVGSPLYIASAGGDINLAGIKVTAVEGAQPSEAPGESPSVTPSTEPSVTPSGAPSVTPSIEPSVAPSGAPSVTPSAKPSTKPSGGGSGRPSSTVSTPTAAPADKPTAPVVTEATKKVDQDGNVDIQVKNEAGEVVAQVSLPATISTAKNEFVDVPDGHWAAQSINNMAALGLVKGVDEGRYDMVSFVDRASIAAMLCRLSNGKAGKATTFADVAADRWYADAIGWAASAGVVTGYDQTTFGPNDVITRQQFAMMLARYAKLIGVDTAADDKALTAFRDGGKTAAWATDGMAWCVEAGILQGRGGDMLDPTANITRAEAAVMLDRMLDLIK